MSGADAARFEAWLAKALDERGLDGQTFAEYGVALFSASVPFGTDVELEDEKAQLLSYLEAVSEQDVQDEVNEAVQIWRGLSALPVPEPEPEPEPQPGPPPPESPTAAAAERVSGEQPWGGCAEDGCLDEDEARDQRLFESWERVGSEYEERADEHWTEEDEGEDLPMVYMLAEMFTCFDEAYLGETLEAFGHDFEQTVAFLMSQYEALTEQGHPAELSHTGTHGGSSEPVPPMTAAPKPKGATVCRHYLQGGCFRADCWFSHDLSDTPCRFWLAGSCAKGSACEFSHAQIRGQAPPSSTPLSVPGATQSSSTERGGAGYVLDSAAFPAISPSSASTAADDGGGVHGRSATSALWQRKDLTAKLKFDKLADEFGDMPEFVIEEALHANGQDYDRCRAALREMFPNARARVKAQPAAATRVEAGPVARQRVSRDVDLNSRAWVETGGVVGRRYKELRTTAIEHARLRNRYFQEATQAYLSGHPAAAKELSRKGRYHHDMSAQLHKEAAAAMFSSRNEGGSGQVIDLHGLHVKEALEVLEALLEEAPADVQHLYVITGTGHHTASGKARLQPAVQAYLDEYGYAYADISTDGRGGMLKIRVR